MKNKNILIGVSGGIAAYKTPDLIRKLISARANVRVILTDSASHLVNPELFGYLTGEAPSQSVFVENQKFEMSHISYQEWADLMVVVPATANVIGKCASALADDLLSTSLLSVTCPILFCPAMNTVMYQNQGVQDNLNILRKRGIAILDPDQGELLCGVKGPGRLPDAQRIILEIERCLTPDLELIKGKDVLLTVGASREYIDPIRFISNGSSGKMGFALARAAYLCGSKSITLLKAQNLPVPITPAKIVDCISTQDFLTNYQQYGNEQDVAVFCAALSDFTVKNKADSKIKKEGRSQLDVEWVPAPDVAKWAGENRSEHQLLIGFSAEDENAEKNTLKKLEKKQLDGIVLNQINVPDQAFASDYNSMTVYAKDGQEISIERMDKESIALKLLQALNQIFCK